MFRYCNENANNIFCHLTLQIGLYTIKSNKKGTQIFVLIKLFNIKFLFGITVELLT